MNAGYIIRKNGKEIARFQTIEGVQAWFSGHNLNYWAEITNRQGMYTVEAI